MLGGSTMSVAQSTCRGIVRAFLFATVFGAMGFNTANAQQSEIPSVAAFLANPGNLLAQNPNGGTLLTNAVQQLALADPSTFKVLLALLANANDLQRGAIGQGLAQATKIEVIADQALAEDWQDQISAIGDPAFNTAATDAFGDVQLGAVGGGPLGGDGGGPSTQGPSTSGAPPVFRSTAVPTQPFTYSASTTAGPSVTFNIIRPNPGPSPSNPVSP